MKTRIITLVVLTVLSCFSSLHAGARGVNFGLVNISKQPMNKEGARLFELLTKDMKEVYNNKKEIFPWRVDESEITMLEGKSLAGVFNHMIILQDKKKLSDLMDEKGLQDGLIAFEYDLAAKKVRLKHFSWDGTENILIKLPLNESGDMKLSVWKHTRHGALRAIGSCFEWNP